MDLKAEEYSNQRIKRSYSYKNDIFPYSDNHPIKNIFYKAFSEHFLPFTVCFPFLFYKVLNELLYFIS